MITSYSYGAEYLPPAPMLEIGISGINDSHAQLHLVALVDSGADATMIPQKLQRQVKASLVRQQVIRGITGQGALVNLYRIQLYLGATIVRHMLVVAAPDGVEAILGRDLLNQFVVTLIGPASTTEVDL